MTLDDLTEILKVYSMACGYDNLFDLLDGQKTIEDYIKQVLEGDQNLLKKLQIDLAEYKAEHPESELVVPNYMDQIARLEKRSSIFKAYVKKHYGLS